MEAGCVFRVLIILSPG